MMMTSRDQWTRLEARIEQLVEGSFARLFGSRLQPRDLAVKLARAVEDNAEPPRDDLPLVTRHAPNTFRVALHPDDLSVLLAEHADLADLLVETIVDLSHRAGLRLDAPPHLRLEPDESVAAHDVHISAGYTPDDHHTTQVLPIVAEAAAAPDTPPAKPYNPQLILNGHTILPLDRSVTNLGRKRDNHVVLDDARVSRAHAQIRLRFGRYVLYDLGSRGGTFVNNHRITESILRPGDVISLAGVTLVYVEDETGSRRPPTDTQLHPPDKRRLPGENDPTL